MKKYLMIFMLLMVLTGCACNSLENEDLDRTTKPSQPIYSSSYPGEPYISHDPNQTNYIVSSIPHTLEGDAYRDVLLGKTAIFDSVSGKEFYIGQIQETINPDIPIEPTSFSVVDMDMDEIEELILTLAISPSNTYGYLVLHYQEEVVYGYIFSQRSLSELKVDGTFWASAGAGDVSICSISFDKETYEINQFTYSESLAYPEMRYIVNHRESTESEFEEAIQQWSEKKNAEWYLLIENDYEVD